LRGQLRVSRLQIESRHHIPVSPATRERGGHLRCEVYTPAACHANISAVRILLSEKTAAELRPEIERVFAGRPFEIVTKQSGLDFEAAFVSRDVTARSTKHQLEPVTQQFHDAMRRAKSLAWVQIHSAGTDRPIYPELMARGVIVTTASGSHAAIVAQTALAGILALARRFPQMMENQRKHQWKSLVAAPPADLEGQTAVILGWGPIAQLLAGWLGSMGVKVEIVRNTPDPAGTHPTFTFERLEEGAPRANWLVIACPLSVKTRNRVDKRVLTAMPAGSHVVNVGRGEIVVESDLIQSLESGHTAGAYLDVFHAEPLPEASPFWDIPNVIVTPHSAGHSAGNEGRVAKIFLGNLANRLEGRALRNIAR